MAAAKRYTSSVLSHYNIGTCPSKKLQWVAQWNVVNYLAVNTLDTVQCVYSTCQKNVAHSVP